MFILEGVDCRVYRVFFFFLYIKFFFETQSLLFLEMTPCCPDIYPPLATLKPGENTSFACHVKLRSGKKVSLEKYLDFTWYRKNGSSYVKISDSETRRYNESCSLLMIKNAKVTPVNGVYYHCEIFYRGNKLKNSKTYDVALVVQGKLVLFYVGYPVVYP